LVESHEGITGGKYEGKSTALKVLCVGLWWPTVYKEAKEYCDNYDVCQRVGKNNIRDEMPLRIQVTL
jgi:hypothetical protein